MTLRLLLLVTLGGGLGSGLRYALSYWSALSLGPRFPYGTLGVNLAGSFLLALLMAAVPGLDAPRAEWKLLLGTGVLGGFTTYSTFNLETLSYLQSGQHLQAGLYLAATVLGSLLAGVLGWAAGRAL